MRRLAGALGLAAATVARDGCVGARGGLSGSPTTAPTPTAPPPTAPPATISPRATTAPPATGNYEFFARDFAGRSVGTTSNGPDAVSTLTFDSPVDEAPGRTGLPALGAGGSGDAIPRES
jgi:hypothetical protein